MFRDSPAFSGFSVNDEKVAYDFYHKILGCDVATSEMGIQIKFSNGHTVFIYEKQDHAPAAFTVLNFPVDDIDHAVENLVANGVAMEQYDNLPAPLDAIGVLRGKAAGMGPNIAWFKDPAGNVLSVLEN